MLEERYLSRAAQIVATDLAEFLAAGAICVVLTFASAGILFGPAAVGILRMALKRNRNEPVRASDSMRGFDDFLPAFVVGLVVLGLTLFGSCFLLLPGILSASLFGLALPIVADGEKSPAEALRRARRLASKDLLSLAILVTATATVGLAGAIFMLVGLIVTVPVALTALALAYDDLSRPEGSAHPGTA